MERIRLENAVFEGQNNAYLLGTDPDATTTLIDTGIAMDDTREELRAGLHEHGVEFKDVEAIVLTHWHFDHAALAGEIQRESGATVHVHEADAPLVAQEPDAVAAVEARQRRLFDEWGMPDEPREELLTFLAGEEDIRGEPADVMPFSGGERFDLGSVELEAVHLPGHAAGLTGFVFDGPEGRELFAGDAILPKYTPNVGGADVRVDDPLARYLETLRGIVETDYARAWPGHRDEIDDPSARARTIYDHHRERTERVLSAVREHGPVDTWGVSAELFGGLSEIHIMHGPGEAHAHLDHLDTAGVVDATDEGYVVADDDPDLDALFPPIEG